MGVGPPVSAALAAGHALAAATPAPTPSEPGCGAKFSHKFANDAAMAASAGVPALKGFESRVNAPKASMEAGVAKATGVKSAADSVRAMRDQAIADAKAGAEAGRLETGQAKETRRVSNQRKAAADEAELDKLPFGLRHFTKALRDITTPKPDIGRVGPETERVQRSEIARDVAKDLEAKYKEQSYGEAEIYKQEYGKQVNAVLNSTFTRRIPDPYSSSF
jgi:hypothetical protein